MVLKRVLVVDDEENILLTIKGSLEDEGFVVDTAATGALGLERVQKFAPDVVLLDIWLPDVDGIELLSRILKLDPTIEVVMMSGHGTIETAVRAIKQGAFDFLEKPIHFEKLLVMLNHVFQLKELKRENRYLREELEEEERIIAVSPRMRKLMALIESAAPSNAWALLTAENGTGRELVARALHSRGKRAHRRFVVMKGFGLTEASLRRQLLGCDRSPGLLAQAEGGTLFFSGVDELDARCQAALLEIVEAMTLDIRVIASTQTDLDAAVAAGGFNRALHQRLNMIPIRIPPLRERAEDIPELVNRFLERYSGGRTRRISDTSMKFLQSYPWPGNVRELKNWIERACILGRSEILDLVGSESMEQELDAVALDGKSFRSARAIFEKQFIIKMLSRNAGNISKTAQTIGLERSYLHKKIKTYGIEI